MPTVGEGLFGFIDFIGLPVGDMGSVPRGGRGKTVAGKRLLQQIQQELLEEEWRREQKRLEAGRRRAVTIRELLNRHALQAYEQWLGELRGWRESLYLPP